MEVQRKTHREMIAELDEAVAFYTQNPDSRGFIKKTGCCVYRHPRNKKKACAIGRKLTDDQIQTLRENVLLDSCVTDLQGLFPNGKVAWSGFDFGFLEALQGFHDVYDHFNKDGSLTKKGKLYVERTKEEIRNGEYDDNDIFL